jgi:hypothetical protein
MQGRNQTVQDCAQMSIQFRIAYSLIRELHLAAYSNTAVHFMLTSSVPECVVLVSLDADVYPIVCVCLCTCRHSTVPGS